MTATGFLFIVATNLFLLLRSPLGFQLLRLISGGCEVLKSGRGACGLLLGKGTVASQITTVRKSKTKRAY
jgi:hypothetical protein